MNVPTMLRPDVRLLVVVGCSLATWCFGNEVESPKIESPSSRPEQKPNIWIFDADDVGWRVLSFLHEQIQQTHLLGSDGIQTPNLDALAASSTTCTQAYSGAANWAPARVIMLTGTCSPQHPIYNVGTGLRSSPPNGYFPLHGQGPRLETAPPGESVEKDMQARVSAIPDQESKPSSPPNAASTGTLPDVSRILFLGDSITYSGHCITLLETAIRIQHPERDVELLNLGLPSETVSGLSEPGHAGGQFPRPHLHERLTRVLDEVRPDFVVACYGMNDGIYYPWSEDRFSAYREGITKLRAEVQGRGAELLLLTPAMFDAQSIAERLLPDGLDAYPQPYKNYDAVLEHYANWLLTKRTDDWNVVDVHGAMRKAVTERRQSEPNFTFAADGVHPNEAGHKVIAQAVANHWGLDLESERLKSRADVLALVAKKQETLKHAWLTRTRHLRPGIPVGLDLEEAKKAAAELTQQILDLLGRE